MIIFHAPEKERYADKNLAAQPQIFLAGTIEMGESRDWQKLMAERLAEEPVTVFNPRRKVWNHSWNNSGLNVAPSLREQIEWELDHMEKADLIALWLEEGSLSPVSLLELGLHLKEGKVIVGCPPGYRRAANVYVTAARYGVQVFTDWDSFVGGVTQSLEKLPKFSQQNLPTI